MNSQTKPLTVTGMGLATAAAIVASTVALPISHGLASAPTPSLSTAFSLVDHEDHWNNGNGNWGNWSGSSSNNTSSGSSSNSSSSESDNEGEHHGGHGGFLSFIGNFLTNNQAAVEAFAAGIPTFYLGPVAVGQGVLANAFYNGYNGSATGLSGVWAYVSSQIGNVTEFIKNAVLTVTHLIPTIHLGPLAVGGGLLASAFFDGYNGSAKGFAGIISYVTASLGLQQAPAPAPAPAAAVSAASALPKATAATVTVATPATAAAAAARKVARSAAAAPRSAAKAASAQAAPKAAAASRSAK